VAVAGVAGSLVFHLVARLLQRTATPSETGRMTGFYYTNIIVIPRQAANVRLFCFVLGHETSD
jgi:tRNA(Phe) wybutosine-synthesizing methylase Tyw3